MKLSCKQIPLLGALFLVTLSAWMTPLAAQETAGKIEGTVRDPNGQPVAAAQVLIKGTSFSALTNESGYYFINNVPTGTYTLRAQSIGLQLTEIENVRVRGGQTLTVPFNLQGAVALEAIAVSVAEAPIVPRDQVASKSIVTGQEVDQLPVSDPGDLITLQPGVVSARNGAVSIRGGRANEAAVFIDGAPVRSARTGGTNVNLGTNAVEEFSVTTGAMGAEFGDAQSGVIAYTTRAGGSNYAGSISYESDEMFGNDVSVGLNRVEASLSGPLVGNLSFNVGANVQGQKSPFRGKGFESIPTYTLGGIENSVMVPRDDDSALVDVPLFVQYGGECDAASNLDAFGNQVECQGRRSPSDWSTNARVNGKLQFTYGSGSRISISGVRDRDQSLVADNWGIEGAGGFRVESAVYVMNWVQQVFRNPTSELSFDVNLSYQTDEVLGGQIDRSYDLNHRDPFMGMQISSMPFVNDFDNFSDGVVDNGVAITALQSDEDWDQLVLNWITNTGTRVPYLNRDGLNRQSLPRVNPWAVSSSGAYTGVNFAGQNQFSQERRMTGRANIDWQAGRFNRFRFGGEYRKTRSNHWNAGLTRLGFARVYTGEPVFGGAYAQDRIDLGDVVLEFGLRWDYYDSQGLFPRVPGRVFTHPEFDVNDPFSETIWRESESHTAWSPRLRASFPITEQTGFRLSYAHQVQQPDLYNMFAGKNHDLANTNTNDGFGGDVDFAKSIQFEFGIRHAFSDNLLMDVSAYNKDKVSDWTSRIVPFFDPFTDRVNNVTITTNADFGNVRGVDLQFQARASNILSGQLNYTFQNSRSTGSDPTDFLFGLSRTPAGVTGERPEAPQSTLRTRDDRRHNLNGSFAVNFPSDYGIGVLKNVGLFGTFGFRSGLPYTRLLNTGVGNRSDANLGLVADLTEPLQASETPWVRSFDLRLTKSLELGGTGIQFYADVRNVFNFTNRTSVFTETGDVVNAEHYRVDVYDPELERLRNDASASGFDIFVNDGGELVEAVNLNNDCSLWKGNGGPLSCHMLRQAEARFGNGDGVYDFNEVDTALSAYYQATNGAWTHLGAPRHMRLGVQLDF